MPKENAERLRRAIAAFNRRDRDGWMALSDPDVVNVPPAAWPESEPSHGRAAVWDFYIESSAIWEESLLEPVELIEVGDDKVVAHVTGQLRGSSSGAGVTWDFWQLVTWRDGTSTRIEWFTDRAEALAAAGAE